MPYFKLIGEDLADIVCVFAFGCRYSEFYYSLKRYLEIKCFKLKKHILRKRIYSPKYMRVIPNPLEVFEPIENFGSYRDLFNWDTLYMMVWQLDFRRNVVRVMGNRGHWHLRFALDWHNVLKFVLFYRTLMKLPTFVTVFKPTVQLLLNSGTCALPDPLLV